MSTEEKIELIHDTVLDIKKSVGKYGRHLFDITFGVSDVQRDVTALQVQVAALREKLLEVSGETD